MTAGHGSLPYPLHLGALGYIEGLTITASPSSEPLCHYFGGVPYALPPAGPFRFRRPRPLPSHHKYGTRANPGRYTGATALCPQPGFRDAPDTTLWDEDCLQVNIWIPTGKKPAGGWPVFFFIHGGWLQFGTANTPPEVGATLISETAFKAIIVMPSYRLNAFGFLASKELQAEAEKSGHSAGNMGFWDQRMALEWTSRSIAHFGGNADMITVGGYSAGSHSAFQQLGHELLLPDSQAIIKRVIMFSNGAGVQPKALLEQQNQFDELLTALNIPLALSASDKLAKLRALSPGQIIEVQGSMKISEFRATSDGSFISKTTIQSINDGSFARKIKQRGIKILNGECRDEHFMYGSWRSPTNSYDDMVRRLDADYPEEAIKRVLPLYFPDGRLPAWAKDWRYAFGIVYADMQVHAMERGFAAKLAAGGLTIGEDLLRYRIDWRAKCVDAFIPPEWKVTHSSDYTIWFWGNGAGDGLSAQEKEVLKDFNGFFASFVRGDDVQWPVKGQKMMRRLTAKGTVDMWEDERWEEGLAVWKAVNEDGERNDSPAKL